MRRRWWLLSGGGIAASVLAAIAVPVSTHWKQVCLYTGSHRGGCDWVFEMTTGEWYNASPIEIRLAALGTPVDHQWDTNYTTTYNVFGQRLVQGCGFPPYQLMSDDHWPMYEDMTDAEVTSLYARLRSSDADVVAAALKEIEQRTNDWIDP